MARAAWLVRVVTDFGSFLPTVDCVDGRINVEHPRFIEQQLPHGAKLSLLPVARAKLSSLDRHANSDGIFVLVFHAALRPTG
jgi:hypothetical protein